MPTTLRPILLGLVLTTLITACSVDDSSLDTALFPCANDGSCGTGWGCKRATPYAIDFCAERCVTGDAATCDGICTRDNLCLRGCQIYEDGTTSACPSADYDCIRTSVESNSGVCYPVTVCAVDGDCPTGQACLSQGFEIDRLYCVPTETTTQPCPAGSVAASEVLPDIASYCFQTCATSDRICPPGFGCLTQVGRFSQTTPPAPNPCVPGIPGITCDDDSNCLFGSCLDTGAVGTICTITCNEASRQFGAAGCSGLSQGPGFDSLFQMECDPAAGGGADGGLCSVRYAIGWPACTNAAGAFPCVSDPPGTMCTPIDAGGMHYDICTRSCMTDADCNRAGSTRNFCAGRAATGTGVCLPDGTPGSRCLSDATCRSGRCIGAVGTNPGMCR